MTARFSITWPDKTQQAIAEQVGCSQQYVGKVQAEVITTGCNDIPTTRTNAQGRTRPTTYGMRSKDGTQQAHTLDKTQQAIAEQVGCGQSHTRDNRLLDIKQYMVERFLPHAR